MRKYRMIYRHDDGAEPYFVQKKALIFWITVKSFYRKDDADAFFDNIINDGKVLRMYDESDRLVDKLKGK